MFERSMKETDIDVEKFSTQLFSLSLKVRETKRRKPKGALGCAKAQMCK